MLFNNKKPDEDITDTIPLEEGPAAVGRSGARDVAHVGRRAVPLRHRCVPGHQRQLQSERDVQVDGELNGDIRCSQLIVSRDATINGNIVADEVVVRGKVKGIIRADQVMLQDTAQVESEIFHKSLVIEQGAIFDGQSCRIDESAGASADLDARKANRRPPEIGARLSSRPSRLRISARRASRASVFRAADPSIARGAPNRPCHRNDGAVGVLR
jgi:cytoskeletal protein CcmA (bactofilin family)